jgi:hypothetical protein
MDTNPNTHMIEWIKGLIKVLPDNKYSYHESLRCNDVFPDPKFSLSSGGINLHNCLNDAGGHEYHNNNHNLLELSICKQSIDELPIVLSDSCIVYCIVDGIEYNYKSITYNHLRIICTSLNTYSPINDKIKQIIYDEVQTIDHQHIYDMSHDLITGFIYIDDLYRNIVQAILTNKLTDFTLISANDNSKQFKCCKALLQTIPYFYMIFQDTEIVDNFIIIPDYECIVKLIKSLFKEGILCTAIEYVEIFELMDKYLMKDYFDSMIQIGYGYRKFIITELIKQERFDKIRTLHRILQDNIKSEMDTNTIKLLIQKIVRSDIGKFFTTFDNWQNLFEDPYKLKYIYNSGELELLNIAEIKPELVLKFLSLYNFANIEKYLDMVNVIECNCFTIFDPSNCGFTGSGCYSKVLIVHSYFPIINYTKYSELPVSIMERTDKYIFIRFNKNVPFKIKNGSIIASDKTITPESPHLGCVTKITAYCNKTKMEANVNEATYIAPSLGLINYKLFITEKEHSKKENHFPFDIKGCMRIWLVEYV